MNVRSFPARSFSTFHDHEKTLELSHFGFDFRMSFAFPCGFQNGKPARSPKRFQFGNLHGPESTQPQQGRIVFQRIDERFDEKFHENGLRGPVLSRYFPGDPGEFPFGIHRNDEFGLLRAEKFRCGNHAFQRIHRLEKHRERLGSHAIPFQTRKRPDSLVFHVLPFPAKIGRGVLPGTEFKLESDSNPIRFQP